MEAWAEQSLQSRLGMYSCDEIIDIFKEATSEVELLFWRVGGACDWDHEHGWMSFMGG